MHTRLSGANTSEDIRDVVLGLSSIDYTFDSSTRSLILPRGVLAQLRAGSYTISVELKNGKTEAFTLTVSDSAPNGESWAVEEYNTFSPSEPKFTLPLTRTSVRTVTVQNNGVTEALNAGSDYTISGQTLTLKKVCARALPQGRYGCRIQRRSGGRHGVCPRYRLCKAQIR